MLQRCLKETNFDVRNRRKLTHFAVNLIKNHKWSVRWSMKKIKNHQWYFWFQPLHSKVFLASMDYKAGWKQKRNLCNTPSCKSLTGFRWITTDEFWFFHLLSHWSFMIFLSDLQQNVLVFLYCGHQSLSLLNSIRAFIKLVSL